MGLEQVIKHLARDAKFAGELSHTAVMVGARSNVGGDVHIWRIIILRIFVNCY